MNHKSGKLGVGLEAEPTPANDGEDTPDSTREESMVAAEVRATARAGAETDLLIEKRKSMEQIRHHRVSWTRVILAVPLALFVALLWLIFRSNVDWPVLVTFTIGTFSCILVAYGSLVRGLYRVTQEDHSPRPGTDALKGKRQSRGDSGDP